ncbi:hypothetical protein [Methylomicrobium sp. Wu6]|uniref:hypothetical protein n=1 Tax=Methylomicrobium sp. Wu6 TaxID=3107928 RepID=UPI002DD634C2|nr:hypothetical protein [Methylomicrobium sp. Wu6]MEC4747315.1 hypothetical protein [Methylomicrobium sp. Wu6]
MIVVLLGTLLFLVLAILQAAWNEIEGRILAAQRACTVSGQYSTNILAGMMNYSLKTYIEVPDEERRSVSTRDLLRSRTRFAAP